MCNAKGQHYIPQMKIIPFALEYLYGNNNYSINVDLKLNSKDKGKRLLHYHHILVRSCALVLSLFISPQDIIHSQFRWDKLHGISLTHDTNMADEWEDVGENSWLFQ